MANVKNMKEEFEAMDIAECIVCKFYQGGDQNWRQRTED